MMFLQAVPFGAKTRDGTLLTSPETLDFDFHPNNEYPGSAICCIPSPRELLFPLLFSTGGMQHGCR